jgi:hypothetical protein
VSEREEKHQLKKYLLNIIPSLYTRSSNLEKLIAELRDNHPIAFIALGRREVVSNMDLTMKLLQVLTTYSLSMFMLAFLYSIQFPTTGNTCMQYKSKVDCLTPFSTLNPMKSMCSWQSLNVSTSYSNSSSIGFELNATTADAQQRDVCEMAHAKYDALAFMILTLLTVMLTMPLQTMLDSIVENTLLAPTLQDVSNAPGDGKDGWGGTVVTYARKASIGAGRAIQLAMNQLSQAIQVPEDLCQDRRRTMRLASSNNKSKLAKKREVLNKQLQQPRHQAASNDKNSKDEMERREAKEKEEKHQNKSIKLLQDIIAYRQFIEEGEREEYDVLWGLVPCREGGGGGGESSFRFDDLVRLYLDLRLK